MAKNLLLFFVISLIGCAMTPEEQAAFSESLRAVNQDIQTQQFEQHQAQNNQPNSVVVGNPNQYKVSLQPDGIGGYTGTATPNTSTIVCNGPCPKTVEIGGMRIIDVSQ